jgi:hypothetical protein
VASPNITVQIKGGTTKVVTAPRLQVSGGGGASSNSFGVVNVATQNNITAVIPTDTLHVEAGTGILLTTNSVTSTLTIVATGGSATDQFARDQANSAFSKANTANVTGQAAFDRANSAYSNANTAIYTAAQIRANISNTAPVNYDPSTGIISHALSGVTPTTYGNTTFVPTITVDNKGHVTSVVNTAIAFPAIIDQFARDNSNGAFTQANTANVTGQAAFDKANSAIYTAAQIRANISNTAPINYAPTTGVISHALSGVTASGYGDAATVPKVVVDDKGHVTSVVNTAIAISAAAITSGTLAVTRGGTGQTAITVNGSLLIGNTVSGGFDVNALTQGSGIQITNDKGSITIAATGGASGNGFGIVAVAGQSNVVAHQANDVINLVAGTGIVLTTDITTNSVTVAATGGSAIDQYARDKANGAAQNSFVTLNVAGQSDIVADSNTDTLTIVGSGITITTNAGTDTLTIQHPASGVVASGYGDAATIPKFVVDANGHLTSVTNTAIAIDASQVTTGILTVARGGTGKDATGLVNGALHIGNTVNTGFDLTTIAQTAPVIVVNGKGTITLSHASSGVVSGTYGGSNRVIGYTVDQFGHLTTATNVAIDLLDAGVITSGTLVVGRGGTGQSSYTNGQILIGNTGSTGLDKATIAQTTPIIVINTQGLITLSHASTAVVAGTYGGANRVIGYTVDAFGHLTAASNVAIDQLPASAITTGILTVARGGTGKDATGLANGQLLIGNTVNTGFDLTTIAQTTPVIVVNGKGTITLSHASSGVVATGYGTLNQIPVFVVDAFGHVTSVTNTAIGSLDTSVLTTGILSVARGGTGKDATGLANGQLLIGNTVNTGFDLTTIAQTAPVIVVNGKGTITLSHASSGVVSGTYGGSNRVIGYTVDQFGHLTAASNVAIDQLPAAAITTGIISVARGGTGKDATGLANGQLLIGNTVNTGFDLTTIAQTVPVIVVNGKGTITLSHATTAVVAGTYGGSNRVIGYTVDAFGHLTTATNVAIDLLDAGVITTGTLVVVRGGTGQSAYTNGQILIGNTGSTGLDKSTIAQTFPIIVTNTQGLINLSHASSGVTLGTYGGSNRVIGYTVDTFGHITTASNVAIDLLPAAAITTGILAVARGGTGKDATGLANGQILIGNTVNTGFDLAGITQTAPVIVSTDKGSIRLSHARSGVTATSYGSASLIPVLTIDDNGHITAATTAAASGLPAASANGQTLIGNTVSGSFDVALIAQTAPIIVTNGKGTINLSHASSGVVAATYGNGTFVPVLTVDTYGHITVGSAAAITGTGAIIKQNVISIGATAVESLAWVVTDASVTAGSFITGSIAYIAQATKALDEMEMDQIDLKFAPAAGSFTVYVTGLTGMISGDFTFNYTIY